MYEDQSFQGNPGIGKAFNPGYTFYEDNSFAPPKQILPQQPQHRAFQQPNLDDFLGRFR